MARCNDKTANLCAARVIPLLLAGAVGYVSWVVVGLIGGYLLRPPPTGPVQARHGAAVAIIVVYFILLLPVLISYFRTIYVIVANPGYVPRGELWHQQHRKSRHEAATQRRRKSQLRSGSSEKNAERSWLDTDAELGHGGGGFGQSYSLTVPPDQRDISAPSPGLEQFYTKDVFVCREDGYPIWCSICQNWKPDRAHHCREVGRCVRKMDHFCPWVGGIVSETNLKFFIQFVVYATVYWAFVLVVMAFFVAEQGRQFNPLNPHWGIALGFAGLFELFSFGMAGSTLQLVLRNTTTIENLTRKMKVWQLAVLTPRPDSIGPLPSNTSKLAFLQVTYPPLGQTQEGSQAVQPNHHSEATANGRPTTASPPPRTFAILKTRPGENPWDLGMYKNFKSVMGDRWWDWLLPVRYSPSCNYGSADSTFPLGTVVDRMRREAGISTADGVDSTASRPSHRRHRGHRRHSEHSSRHSEGVRREKRNAGRIEPEKSGRRNHQ